MNEPQHWLVRPATIRLLWKLFIGVLAATVLVDLAVEHHGGLFGIDESFGFAAWFGFVSCVVLIALSKLLGVFLKREDSYYDE
jgi:hypothetical protein